MLEAEGLLQIVPNRGAYVPSISDREVDEVMEARMLIEVFCAQRVAESSIDVTAALSDLLADQERLVHDLDAFMESDRAFHSTIVDAAGHGIFRAVYDALRDRQLRMGVRALLTERGRAEQVLREHHAIADALTARDANRIKQTVEIHIRETLGALGEPGRSR